MLHELHIYDKSLTSIEIGLKTIELRLHDEKRSKIKVGDYIRLLSIEIPTHTVLCKVTNLSIYNTFKELYENMPLLKCGYTKDNIDKASYKDMEQYYSIEKQKKYEVVGIELKVIS